MDIQAWLSNFKVTAVNKLELQTASAFVGFAKRHASNLVSSVKARRGELGELIIVDFRTGCPQRPVYSIKHTERLAIRFRNDDTMPLVYVLRDDFPDTPHQLLTWEDVPRAICIDDRAWPEARLTWTPAELVHRILSWFERAAEGKLHDPRQPLEPSMIGSPDKFIISRDDLAQSEDIDLAGICYNNDEQTLHVKRLKDVGQHVEAVAPLCFITYRVAPENMRRLTFAPASLGSLADMLSEREINLFDDLCVQFRKWLKQSQKWPINGGLVVIVEMPIISPNGDLQGGTDLRAFITTKSVGEIAVKFGIAEQAGSDEGSEVGYVPSVPEKTPDFDAIRAIGILPAEVYYTYDRILAAELTGQTKLDERKVVIVGAGAIGSHIADCLSREGRFHWTVIDDDRLLPHNLARHIGRRGSVSARKAELVASAVLCNLEATEPIANPIIANVMITGKEKKQIDAALNEADLIIDATASVVAGRYLSDHPSKARRMSVFFNPPGTAGVLLVEPEDRQLTIRDLEAKIFSLVSKEDKLANLLAPPESDFAYIGACRAITNRMPMSNVMALSGLLAHALGNAVNQSEAVMKTWVLNDSGDVEYYKFQHEGLKCFQANGWRICVDNELIERVLTMRNEKLPNETGGILTGVVDIPAKCIHLTDAESAPKGSIEKPSEFRRGTDGVKEHLNKVYERTHGHVRYVGEWHSHPQGATTHPSSVDMLQIDWLSSLFEIGSSPTLMLIAGNENINIIFANKRAVSRKRRKS